MSETKIPKGYKRTEVGVIPEDWKCFKTSEIASNSRNSIVGGPFGSDLVSTDYVEFGVPVIRGQNMGDKWVVGLFVFVSPSKAKSLEANLARPKDLVFTQRGTLGQVSLVPDIPYGAYLVSQSQMKLSVNTGFADQLFFFYVYTSRKQQKLIELGTIQTGVPHINLGILKGIQVPVPPLPEQRAIATALSDVDALIAGLDQLIAKKRDLKQAAMQQLLTGQKRLPGFQGKWEHVLLGTIANIKTGPFGTLLKAGEYSDGDGVPLVSVGEIGNGVIDIDEHTPLIPSEVVKRLPEYVLRTDDIVLGRKGAVDRSAIVKQSQAGWFLGSDGIRIRLSNSSHAPFIAWQFQRAEIKSWLIQNSTGTTMASMNQDILNRVPLATPPFAEQTAIATILSDMDSELTALEQRRDKTRALKQGMMQELLTGRTRLV